MPPGWPALRMTFVATKVLPHWGHVRLVPAAPFCPRLARAVLLIFSATAVLLSIQKHPVPSRVKAANNTVLLPDVKKKELCGNRDVRWRKAAEVSVSLRRSPPQAGGFKTGYQEINPNSTLVTSLSSAFMYVLIFSMRAFSFKRMASRVTPNRSAIS